MQSVLRTRSRNEIFETQHCTVVRFVLVYLQETQEHSVEISTRI